MTNPYSGMSLDQLKALRAQAVAQQTSGFFDPGNASTAPDAIAAREEYLKAKTDLAKDTADFRDAAPSEADIQRFVQLNQTTPTGGLSQNIPFVSDAIAPVLNRLNPGLAEMQKIASGIAAKSRVTGQRGSTFLTKLMQAGNPAVNNYGGVNQNIANHMLATIKEQQDELDFKQNYLNAHGNLNNADTLWQKYVADNPYQVSQPVDPNEADAHGYPEAGKVVLNDQITPWQEYFGLTPPNGSGPKPAPMQNGVKYLGVEGQ